MSSPNLNYIIGLGAIVLYFNVIVLVIPTTDEDFSAVLCNVSMAMPHCESLILCYTFSYTLGSYHLGTHCAMALL